MGGHVDVCPVAPGEVKSGVDAGRLKVLAIVGNDRSSLYPNVPSTKELGYNMEVFAWGCFGGPGNMPADVKSVLEASFAKAIQTKEWQDMCAQNGWSPAYLNAADAQKFAEDQAAWYQRVIPTLNMVN
jgi:tripartite-type tricarboxylate transporter receptor subunit TctC